MTIKLPVFKIREAGLALTLKWEESKSTIHFSNVKRLYNLLSVKKAILEVFGTIQETATEIVLKNGGSVGADGTAVFEDEARDKIIAALNEFNKEEVEITFNKLIITDEDIVPIEILEPMYDFVEFQDQA